jgi:hypothetical protein
MQIERKLHNFEVQKQQMARYKLEYTQLMEKLSLYKDTLNLEEVAKIQERIRMLVEQAKQYAAQREAQVKEIKILQARIEELKRM